MKVKELIKKLQKMNPKSDVFMGSIGSEESGYETYHFAIDDVVQYDGSKSAPGHVQINICYTEEEE